MSDLRNCCSDEDLFTVPWCLFILHYLPFLSVFPLNGEKITKEGVNKVAPSVYCITHMILISSAPAVNTINRCYVLRVLY